MMTPICPACRTSVPLIKTQWGLGKPFACKGCGTELVFDKQFLVPMLAVVTYLLLKPTGGTLARHLVVIGPLVLALAIYSSFVMKPRLAEPPR